MKQTAVEWLIQQIVNRINSNSISRPLNIIFEQALEMEKQQKEKCIVKKKLEK